MMESLAKYANHYHNPKTGIIGKRTGVFARLNFRGAGLAKIQSSCRKRWLWPNRLFGTNFTVNSDKPRVMGETSFRWIGFPSD